MTSSLANRTDTPRFTLDGTPELEERLGLTCARVLRGVKDVVGESALEALVLGGGYGRGQGGVLKTSAGEEPYNDLEFYVFLRGSRLLNQRRFTMSLRQLGEELTPEAGLHVEFKVDSLARLRAAPITMFSYDLVAAHRIIAGSSRAFAGCAHHLEAEQIPLSEGARLLLNRCTGLLLVKALLRKPELAPDDPDFIGRNLAKARLGFGDAVLTAFGGYHYDCRERHARLRALEPELPLSWLRQVKAGHASGVEFKLHPHRSAEPRDLHENEFERLSELGREVWLWLEGKRLGRCFESIQDYATADTPKGSDAPWLLNLALHLRTFGCRGLGAPRSFRYPRERLFEALALLLWGPDPEESAAVRTIVQGCLCSRATCWQQLVEDYQRIWSNYG